MAQLHAVMNYIACDMHIIICILYRSILLCVLYSYSYTVYINRLRCIAIYVMFHSDNIFNLRVMYGHLHKRLILV